MKDTILDLHPKQVDVLTHKELLYLNASYPPQIQEALEKNAIRHSLQKHGYIDLDSSMVEINPLILTKESQIICLDAKINFDDNALFKHPEISKLRDLNEEDPTEIEASKFDLTYIKLDGSIGCMVNGAGLAMATMDIIKLYAVSYTHLTLPTKRIE